MRRESEGSTLSPRRSLSPSARRPSSIGHSDSPPSSGFSGCIEGWGVGGGLRRGRGSLSEGVSTKKMTFELELEKFLKKQSFRSRLEREDSRLGKQCVQRQD